MYSVNAETQGDIYTNASSILIETNGKLLHAGSYAISRPFKSRRKVAE